jgi:hypothetical protein
MERQFENDGYITRPIDAHDFPGQVRQYLDSRGEEQEGKADVQEEKDVR